MDKLFMAEEGKSVKTERIIFTPSDFAKNSLLFLQETGKLQAILPHQSKRNGLESYLFFWVSEGSGELQYNGKKYKLKKNDCVFIDCTQPYSHSTEEENPWSLRWVHFNGSAMQGIYQEYLERGGMPMFHGENVSRYQDIFDTIFQAASFNEDLQEVKLHAVLSELIVLLFRSTERSPSTGVVVNSTIDIKEVKAYLDEHYMEELSLDDLAAVFFISKYYLLRLFKRCYGTTIINYITTLRITQVKKMLRVENERRKKIPLQQIADACGFNSVAYMCKVFKKYENVSMGEYREQWKG